MTDSALSKPRVILVVDDEPLLRLNLVYFFIDEGYEVFEAADADHAIACLEAHPDITVVVTDVQMPGAMNGARLAHYVRDKWPPTTLIVVSGAMDLQEDDLPANAAFVSKPFDPRFVLSEIERLSSHP